MYKLLIADDEEEIRNGISSYFPWGEIGFEVVGQVSDGTQIMSFLENHEVDVILTDIKMPQMTGIEVAKQLFEQKHTVKIVFLSGYREFEYAQQALAFGVKSYILKPTKYSELHTVFSELKKELDGAYLSTDQVENVNDDTASEDLDKVIKHIKDYVSEYYKDASLEGAAQIVHMNPQYVSKYFKEKAGINFSDYLVDMKMKKAGQLLDDLAYKIYQVSEMVGYSNSKNFTRTFRKYYGMSPKEYRNRVERVL